MSTGTNCFLSPFTSYRFTSFLYSSKAILGYQLVRGLKKWNEAANRLLKIVTVDNLRVSSATLLAFDVKRAPYYASTAVDKETHVSVEANGRTVTSRVQLNVIDWLRSRRDVTNVLCCHLVSAFRSSL